MKLEYCKDFKSHTVPCTGHAQRAQQNEEQISSEAGGRHPFQIHAPAEGEASILVKHKVVPVYKTISRRRTGKLSYSCT
jgi:hypothetical protein